jgi:predicted TPR repeat methyltransferase
VTRFLGRAYEVSTDEETRELYDDWAATYDAEVAENGYVTPARCAEALARHAPLIEPVLDIGCGTGLSGVALRARGFGAIDGVDTSPAMLARAEATGAYRDLRRSDGGAPFEAGAYRVVTAIGVIGHGAAPASLFDAAWAALPEGGFLCLSLNDHALAEPDYPARIDARRAHVLFEEYGPHLPGIDLRSRVYVLRK